MDGTYSGSRATDMNARSLLIRGMLAGVVAGVFALVFAYVFGEPPLGRAIAFEGAGPGEPELVSRAVQSTAGLATAVLVYGVAIGGIFGLAFAVAYGRIGRLGARSTAALVALGAFVSAELAVFVKYPANPPAVGNPDTINTRTALYFLMLVISVAAAIASVWIGQRLRPRLGAWNAGLAAGAGYLAVLAMAYVVLPTVNEVPQGFPADVLWKFRLASVGTQLVLWAGMGLLFGFLTERAMRAPTPKARSLDRAAR
jgi:Probable cobalt transporter subunit (CbtA)